MRPLIEGAIAMVSLGALFRGIALVIDNPMTVMLLGAVVVSFLLGRLGVPITEANAAAWRRAGVGALASALVVVVAVLVAVLLGASVAIVPPSGAIAFGLAESFAVAFRDEIWLHGIPFAYARRAGLPSWAPISFAIAASVAVVAAAPGATLVGLAVVAASSACFVVLWARDHDGWAPIAAHFVWAWLTGSLLAGELFDLGTQAGRLSSGLGSAGWLGAASVVAFAAVAVAIARRGAPRGEAP